MLVMLALFVVVSLYRTRATCSGIAIIIVANPFVLAGMAPRSSREASPHAPATSTTQFWADVSRGKC